jgi:hypothetical protein
MARKRFSTTVGEWIPDPEISRRSGADGGVRAGSMGRRGAAIPVAVRLPGPGMVAVRTGTWIGALAVVVAVVSAAFVVLAPAGNAAVCTPDPLLCPHRI